MLREIREQPAVAAGLVDHARGEVADLVRLLRRRPPQGVIFAARGTSDNAAVYGKYMIESYLGLPVSLAAPSIVTLYSGALQVRGWLVAGLSQSGESADIVEFIRACRSGGAFTVAVTNNGRSSLAGAAHRTLLLRAGPERSVAATKTYTAQLFLLAMVVLMWSRSAVLPDLLRLPDLLEDILSLEGTVRDHARRYRRMEECLVTGRGFNYATAFEAALKLKEVCYVAAEALSAADLLHGPIAVVEHGFPVMLFALRGKPFGFLCDVARRLMRRGAELIVIIDDPQALPGAATRIHLPVDVPEALSPIPAIIPAQLFAYHLAVARGVNPDRPRGLRKVTRTW